MMILIAVLIDCLSCFCDLFDCVAERDSNLLRKDSDKFVFGLILLINLSHKERKILENLERD